MTVAITAIFDSLAAAQSAADCMAVRPGGDHRIQISLEHCDHGAATAMSRMIGHGRQLAQPLETTPTSAAAVGRSQSAILRIRCSQQLSSFAARELASLGAEKITVTPIS